MKLLFLISSNFGLFKKSFVKLSVTFVSFAFNCKILKRKGSQRKSQRNTKEKFRPEMTDEITINKIIYEKQS
jgi:hypothetical protein